VNTEDLADFFLGQVQEIAGEENVAAREPMNVPDNDEDAEEEFSDGDEESWEEEDVTENVNTEDLADFFLGQVQEIAGEENAAAREPMYVPDNDEDVEEEINNEVWQQMEKDKTPYGHIKMLLSLIDSRSRTQMWWQNEADDLAFKRKVGEKLIEFLELDPSCASKIFEIQTGDDFFGGVKMPLMHWAVTLELPLVVFQAIHNAFPGACKMCYPEGDSDQLPISKARIKNSNLEIIRFLLETHPASATSLRIERLRNLFWSSTPENFDEAFKFIQSLFKQEDVAELTSSGTITWDHTKPFPAELLNFIVKFHKLKSMTVKGTTASGYNRGVKLDVDRRSCILHVQIICDRSFDLAVEELLKLPIPLRELGTYTMDEDSGIRYLICTISPSVMDSEEQNQRRELDHQAMVESMERLGLPPIHPSDPHYMTASMAGMLPMPPSGPPVEDLDLSSVERLSCSSLIPSTVELFHLMKGLQNLPNLKFLELDGMGNAYKSVTLPKDEGFEDLLALTDQLEELTISWLKTCIPTVAQFVKKTTKLKVLSLTSNESFSLKEINQLIKALRVNKSIEHLQFGRCVAEESKQALLEFVKENNHSALKTYQGYEDDVGEDSPLVKEINYWCHLYQSTSWLEAEDRTKEEAVSEYSKCIDDLPLLYGLLRHRPDLWT